MSQDQQNSTDNNTNNNSQQGDRSFITKDADLDFMGVRNGQAMFKVSCEGAG